MRKIFLLLLFAVTVSGYAVPAKRGVWATLKLVDGTEVRAMLCGDEHMRFFRAEDGTCYVKSPDGQTFVKADMGGLRDKAAKRQMKASKRRASKMCKARKALGDDFSGQYLGEKKGLIILVEFQDKKFTKSHDQALFNHIANTEGYDQNGFKGSVSDYFKAQSDGQFLLNFDVVGPVEVSYKYSYYGENTESGEDKAPQKMVIEACQLVNDEVDFSKYDWNNDGEVDQVFILYAGHGEADYYDIDTDVIWPHEFFLSADPAFGSITLDGVVIDTYACSNEINRDGGLDGIGTICHEFSHCLGYPDLYDTQYTGCFGMGEFDLMASGTDLDNGFTPAGFSGYEKMMAGWQKPIELKDYTEVKNLEPMSQGGDFYIIYNDAHKDEYYLVENRQQTGYDKYIPGKGLMITHVDYDSECWENNIVNSIVSFSDGTRNDHQRLTIFHADNDDDSDYWVEDYWSGNSYYLKQTMENDLYPYKNTNSLTNLSKPAATLYHANSDGKKYMSKPITSIQQNDDLTVDFVFGASVIPDPSGDGSFVKVTSDDQISVGSEYILVNEEYEVAAYEVYKTSNSSYLTSIEATISDNTVDTDGMVFTLGGNSNGYSLQMTDGKYLTATKAKSLTTTTKESKMWKVTSSADGYSVEATTASYGKIQYNYNNGKDRFMNYTSAQEPAVLYVKKVPTGISSVAASPAKNDNRIYSIDGRFMGTDFSLLNHGIYLVNGKKVVK